MDAVGAVTPGTLVSTILLAKGDRPVSKLEIKASVFPLMSAPEAGTAQVYLPRADRYYAVGVGLWVLTLRHMIVKKRSAFDSVNQAALQLLSECYRPSSWGADHRVSGFIRPTRADRSSSL